MAYFFGLNVGENEYTAANNTVTTSKDVEVVINTNANVPTLQELLVTVEKLENFILRQGKAWT